VKKPKGTLPFMSPDLLLSVSHSYGYDGHAADVYACGVILYVLLCGPGKRPVDIKHLQSVFALCKDVHYGRDNARELIASVHFYFASPTHHVPCTVSDEARHLLAQMLEMDPKKRISFAEIASHSWLVQHDTGPRKQGWLSILQNSLLGIHKNVYVVIGYKTLEIYKDRFKSKLTRTLQIAQYELIGDLSDRSSSVFTLIDTRNAKNKYTFKAKSVQERDAWIDAIRAEVMDCVELTYSRNPVAKGAGWNQMEMYLDAAVKIYDKSDRGDKAFDEFCAMIEAALNSTNAPRLDMMKEGEVI